MRLGVGATIVLALVGIAIAVLVSAFGAAGSTRSVSGGTPEASGSSPDSTSDAAYDPSAGAGGGQSAGAAAGAVILVHLLGAVQRPGLYELRDGDRVVDAVAAAGGFADGADQGALNLARRLSDGEQVYVSVVGEAPPPTATGQQGTSATGGKVDLNAADATQLDTLPGVGPATAAAILAWREENGRFTAVEDLLSVSGIGEKTLADLRDLVTV